METWRQGKLVFPVGRMLPSPVLSCIAKELVPFACTIYSIFSPPSLPFWQSCHMTRNLFFSCRPQVLPSCWATDLFENLMKAIGPLPRNGPYSHHLSPQLQRVSGPLSICLLNVCGPESHSAVENGESQEVFEIRSDWVTSTSSSMVENGFRGRWSKTETKGRKTVYEATMKVQRPELKQCQWKRREDDSLAREIV